ncbi:uncharacterized protein LOC144348378 [Saccoglossus kowalevskii]
MNVSIVFLVFTVIGATLAEDVGKEETKTRVDKPVEKPLPHTSSEQKSDMVNLRKEHLNTRPEVKSSADLMKQKQKLLRDEKEKIAEIRKSDISPEEKSLKMESLRSEYRSEITDLAKQAKSAIELEAVRRRTLEKKKEARKSEKKQTSTP